MEKNSGNKPKPRLFYLVTLGIAGGAQTHVLHCAMALRDEFEVAVGVGR